VLVRAAPMNSEAIQLHFWPDLDRIKLYHKGIFHNFA